MVVPPPGLNSYEGKLSLQTNDPRYPRPDGVEIVARYWASRRQSLAAGSTPSMARPSLSPKRTSSRSRTCTVRQVKARPRSRG